MAGGAGCSDLEPRIRGLSEGNLNVQIDGAFVHGGCPNRMDPPSSFASLNAFDEVTVIKGVQSMRYGPGGTAGTASWVQGDNRTDDRPLAQIPPLQGWLQVDYGIDRWSGATVLRWASAQNRVDDNPMTGSGQDYGETAGYGVLDLSG